LIARGTIGIDATDEITGQKLTPGGPPLGKYLLESQDKRYPQQQRCRNAG